MGWYHISMIIWAL